VSVRAQPGRHPTASRPDVVLAACPLEGLLWSRHTAPLPPPPPPSPHTLCSWWPQACACCWTRRPAPWQRRSSPTVAWHPRPPWRPAWPVGAPSPCPHPGPGPSSNGQRRWQQQQQRRRQRRRRRRRRRSLCAPSLAAAPGSARWRARSQCGQAWVSWRPRLPPPPLSPPPHPRPPTAPCSPPGWQALDARGAGGRAGAAAGGHPPVRHGARGAHRVPPLPGRLLPLQVLCARVRGAGGAGAGAGGRRGGRRAAPNGNGCLQLAVQGRARTGLLCRAWQGHQARARASTPSCAAQPPCDEPVAKACSVSPPTGRARPPPFLPASNPPPRRSPCRRTSSRRRRSTTGRGRAACSSTRLPCRGAWWASRTGTWRRICRCSAAGALLGGGAGCCVRENL
jgi:hypothetical protein